MQKPLNMNIKKYLPYVLIIAGFAILSLGFFFPLLQGKALMQQDINNFKGMSQEIKQFRETFHEEPLWTNSMFGGMPAYQISTAYPSNWIAGINKAFLSILPHPANYLFLLMLGFFLTGLMIGANAWISAALAVGFAFSSYSLIVIEAGHNSKVHAIAYFAPVIGAVILTFRGRYVLGAVLTALFLSLEISTNHLQITYYLMLTLLVFGIGKLIEMSIQGKIAEFLKSSFVLIPAVVIAVLPNLTSLMATYEYGQYTMRGKSELKQVAAQSSGLNKDYALGWSYGVAETGTILIPNFNGGASQQEVGAKSEIANALKENGVGPGQIKQFIKAVPTYWGDQPFTSGPVYLGASIVFLFVLGLFALGGADRWWILIATLLSIALSWGKNWPVFTDFFFDHFPGYNKFRAVSMTLVIAQVMFPFLALLIVKRIVESKQSFGEWKKYLLWSLYITGGICLVFILLPGAFFDFEVDSDNQLRQSFPEWFMTALIAERESMLRMDALRSLVFIGLSFGLIWFFLQKKINETILLAGLALVFLIDLGGVDKRYIGSENFVSKSKVDKPFQPTEADERILQDKDPNFRVLNLAVNTFNDASTSYYHKSIGGYHGAKLKRYQELIDSCLSKSNLAVINMLNTKYVIIRDNKSGQLIPQRNPQACGNAWFVSNVQLVPDADSEIKALNDSFAPLKTAIVNEKFKEMIGTVPTGIDSTASIKLTNYKPNDLSYEYVSSKEQVAVFSEIYYEKGWNAYVDGQLTPHFQTDYVLRGMKLPAGKHTVEFKFEPKVYQTGEKISLAGSVVLLLLVAGGIFMEVKKSGGINSNDQA
ncbi:MAG: YfhO family protein [Bacteroidia bacterium]|nr:YfhO family protein [Bacteroidia bacterium]